MLHVTRYTLHVTWYTVFMHFSFWNKSGNEKTLLIDIGSAAVRVARAKRSESGITISKTSLYDIPYKKTRTALSLQKSAISALLEAALTEKEYVAQASHVLLSLGAPWYESEIMDFTLRDERISISEAASRVLLKEGEPKTKNEVCIEAMPLAFIKNGYLLAMDTRVEGSADIRALITRAPRVFLDEVWQTLGHAPEERSLGVHSHAYLIHRALIAHKELADTSYITVHVTGEITEVFLSRGGMLVAAATIPQGTRALLRTAHKNATHSEEEIASEAFLVEQGMLHEEDAHAHADIRSRVLALWSVSLGKTIATLACDVPLPTQVFLFTDARYEKIYTDTLFACLSALEEDVGNTSERVVSADVKFLAEGIECESGSCDNRMVLLARTLL